MTTPDTTCHRCHRTMPDVTLGVHLRLRHPDVESGLENTTIGDGRDEPATIGDPTP